MRHNFIQSFSCSPQVPLLLSVQEEKITLRVTAANINFPYFQNALLLKTCIFKCQQSPALKQSCLCTSQNLWRRLMVLQIHPKLSRLPTFWAILHTNASLYLAAHSVPFHRIKTHECSTFLDAWICSWETSPATKYFDIIVLIHSAKDIWINISINEFLLGFNS